MSARRVTLKIHNEEYNILRLTYGFHRRTDTKGRPSTGMLGGHIFLQLESAPHTHLLEQMLIKTLPPVAGSLEIVEGEDEICVRKIAFQDAYLYQHQEELWTDSSLPMLTTLAITPLRLDINHTVRLDRRWPQTYGFWWDVYKPQERGTEKGSAGEEHDTEVAGIEILTPLVHREPNRTEGMEIGQEYELRVTGYTNGRPEDPEKIRWQFSYISHKGEVVVGTFEEQRGEQIVYHADDNGAIGNRITFYAYVTDKDLGAQCQAYVNPLYRYKGTKEWGKLGEGMERKSQRLSLEEICRECKLDKQGQIRATSLNRMSEEKVRSIFEGRFSPTGVKNVLSNNDNLLQRVLNSFYTGSEPKMSFGPTSILSQKLKVNPTFQEYYKKYLGVVKEIIENKNLVLEVINGEDIVEVFKNIYKTKVSARPNFSRISEIIPYDYYGLMGGTQKIRVDLDVIQTDQSTYIVKTRMYIGDWYGADNDDINGMTLKGAVDSLSAFFWLQHHYGYHPFETEIIYDSIDVIKL